MVFVLGCLTKMTNVRWTAILPTHSTDKKFAVFLNELLTYLIFIWYAFVVPACSKSWISAAKSNANLSSFVITSYNPRKHAVFNLSEITPFLLMRHFAWSFIHSTPVVLVVVILMSALYWRRSPLKLLITVSNGNSHSLRFLFWILNDRTS